MPALLGLLLVAGTPALAADEPWVEVRSPHFVVLSDASRSRAWAITDELERIRATFRMALTEPPADPEEPILIYAMSNEDAFAELLPELSDHLPVGLFRQTLDRDRIALRLDVTGENRFHTVYHEYHHSLFRDAARRAPSWASEGLAEFWSQARIRRDEVELGNPNPDHLSVLRRDRLLPLKDLVAIRGFRHDADPGFLRLFYAQSWALTHWLMLGDGTGQGRAKMARYLDLVEDGADSLEAFEEVFGPVRAAEAGFKAYLRQSMFPRMRMDAPEEPEEAFAVRKMSPSEIAAAKGSFLVAGERPDEALPYLEEALRLDPDSRVALESMGYYYFRRGELADAEPWFERARAAGFDGLVLHLFRAMRAKAQGNDTAFEEALLRTLELEPDFAPAYIELSAWYAMSGRLAEAHPLAERAVELEPDTVAAWTNLGHIFLVMDQPRRAREIVDAVRENRLSSEETRLVERLEDAIAAAQRDTR